MSLDEWLYGILNEPRPGYIPTKRALGLLPGWTPKRIGEITKAEIALNKITDVQDNLADRLVRASDDVAVADTALRQLETYTPASRQIEEAVKRLDSAFLSRQAVVDQITTTQAKWDELASKLLQLRKEPIWMDWESASRAVREAYIEKLVAGAEPIAKVSTATGFNTVPYKKVIGQMVEAVSVGRTRLLEELSDVELRVITDDLLPIWQKAPANFKYPASLQVKIGSKLLFGGKRWPSKIAARFASGVPPGYNFGTPAHYWFRQMGIPQIPKLFEWADADGMRAINRWVDGWEDILEPLGGIKKVAKDADTKRRIFNVANGEFEKFAGEIKLGRITERRANLEWAAGKYINSVGDEILDMYDAKRMWPEGLKREEFYIRNIVERSAADATRDPTVFARAFDAYANYAGTDINIGELIQRVPHDLAVLEDADAAFRTMIHNHIWKLEWEPAIKQAKNLASITGNENVIRYTDNAIKYAIRGEMTPLEAALEGPVGARLQTAVRYGSKIIPGYNFVAQDRALRQMSQTWMRGTFHRMMWMNFRSWVRNHFQVFHSMSSGDTKAFSRGWQGLFTDGGKDLLEKHNNLRVGRMPMVEFDATAFSRLGRAGHKLFRFADSTNLNQNFLASVDWLVRKNKEHIDVVNKFGRYGVNTDESYRAIARAFDAGELAHVKETAYVMTKINQYGYRPWDMPYAWFRTGAAGKPFLQFMSWPANYFYVKIPELFKWTMTGVGPGGLELTRFERMALLKHIGTMKLLQAAGHTMGIELGGVIMGKAPISAGGPTAGFLDGMFTAFFGVTSQNEQRVSEGLALMKRSSPFGLPTGITRPLTAAGPLEVFFRPYEE